MSVTRRDFLTSSAAALAAATLGRPLLASASQGQGLGNQFLSHIREVDAVAHVVRCFDDDNVIHVENRVDPIADIATINTELCLKDLDTVGKRLDRAR